METISRYCAAFCSSLVIASLASALLFSAKEDSPELMAWMQDATGHEWLTHSLVVLLCFLFLGFALAGFASPLASRLGDKSLPAAVFASVLAAGALIVGVLLV